MTVMDWPEFYRHQQKRDAREPVRLKKNQIKYYNEIEELMRVFLLDHVMAGPAGANLRNFISRCTDYHPNLLEINFKQHYKDVATYRNDPESRTYISRTYTGRIVDGQDDVEERSFSVSSSHSHTTPCNPKYVAKKLQEAGIKFHDTDKGSDYIIYVNFDQEGIKEKLTSAIRSSCMENLRTNAAGLRKVISNDEIEGVLQKIGKAMHGKASRSTNSNTQRGRLSI